MSTNLQLISLNIDKDLLANIKNLSSEISMSDFIRKAVENELNNLNNSIKFEEVKQEKTEQNISKIQKILDEVKLKNMESKLNDMETKLQVLNFEILKVLELNKVIYRRTTMATDYSFKLLSHIISDEFAHTENKKWIDIVAKELENY